MNAFKNFFSWLTTPTKKDPNTFTITVSDDGIKAMAMLAEKYKLEHPVKALEMGLQVMNYLEEQKAAGISKITIVLYLRVIKMVFISPRLSYFEGKYELVFY